MKPKDVETWAVRVVEGLRAGRRNEDSRVELKRTWPDTTKTARRIAGHLNSSRGEAVLWLIGVAEDGQLKALEPVDFARWWDDLLTHFDGPVPRPTEVFIDDGGDSYIAIGIEGPTPPYVVKNPSQGSTGCGPVALEVPWREMTAVRTARHSDLLKILAPVARIPEVEVLSVLLKGTGSYDPTSGVTLPIEEGQPCAWDVDMELYVVPADERPVVFPDHRTSIRVTQADTFGELPLHLFVEEPSGSGMLRLPGQDHIQSRPGRVRFRAAGSVNHHRGMPNSGAVLELVSQLPWVSPSLYVRCDLDLVAPFRFALGRFEVGWRDS